MTNRRNIFGPIAARTVTSGGTVTSVGLAMPTPASPAYTVTNNPVTGSGTLTVTANGTTSQYVRGDGSLATFPSLTGYVPYTGATSNVNLGSFALISPQIYGSTASGGNLTVNSTSNATQGNVYLNPLAVNATQGSVFCGYNGVDPLPPSGDPNHSFGIVNNNSTMQMFSMWAFGSGGTYQNNMHFYRSRGTIAAPTAIQNGDFLLSMGMRGYDGTNMSQSATAIQSLTTQTWTTSAHGAAIQFATTPNNSLARAVRMYIGGSAIGVNTVSPTNTFEVVSEAIDQKRALLISGTFNATASSFNTAVDAQITSISNGQSQYAYNSDMLAGGTEAKIYGGARFATAAAGTGANLFGVVCNVGSLGNASATTTGYNVGHYGFVSGGNLNAGIVGRSVTTKNSATNIGGAFVGLNAGTSPIQIGVFAGLMSSDPTFVSAALLADNGAVAVPIAIFRDNGTEVARFADGGNLGLGVTSPTAYLQIANGGTSKASLNLVSGASAPTSPNNGDIWFDGTNLFMRIGGATKTFTII